MGVGKTNTSILCALLLLVSNDYNYNQVSICTLKNVEDNFI